MVSDIEKVPTHDSPLPLGVLSSFHIKGIVTRPITITKKLFDELEEDEIILLIEWHGPKKTPENMSAFIQIRKTEQRLVVAACSSSHPRSKKMFRGQLEWLKDIPNVQTVRSVVDFQFQEEDEMYFIRSLDVGIRIINHHPGTIFILRTYKEETPSLEIKIWKDKESDEFIVKVNQL